MRKTAMAVSVLSLAVLLAGPVLRACGLASADLARGAIVAGTIGWFASAPFWMRPARDRSPRGSRSGSQDGKSDAA